MADDTGEAAGGFPAPGDVFEQRYRIERVLSGGGFGRIFLAEQIDLGRQVAIKILRVSAGVDTWGKVLDAETAAAFSARFEREGRLASQLRDPHTVITYDYGETKAGLLFIAMEYVDGSDIARELGRVDCFEPRRAAEILRQILESLHEAHSLGFLHRDIKPANIMLYEHLGVADRVKVLDFGIAKQMGEGSTNDPTREGHIVGTPRYMAPEYFRGSELGPPSDLYAVGLVAYELLTGEKAVTERNNVSIVERHLAPETFQLPAEAHVPKELAAIVHRLLAKQVAERYQSAQSAREALDAFLAPPAPSQDLVLVSSENKTLKLAVGVTSLAAAIGIGAAVFASANAQGPVRVVMAPAPRAAAQPEVDLSVMQAVGRASGAAELATKRAAEAAADAKPRKKRKRKRKRK